MRVQSSPMVTRSTPRFGVGTVKNNGTLYRQQVQDQFGYQFKNAMQIIQDGLHGKYWTEAGHAMVASAQAMILSLLAATSKTPSTD
jgi:hypothetical protein